MSVQSIKDLAAGFRGVEDKKATTTVNTVQMALLKKARVKVKALGSGGGEVGIMDLCNAAAKMREAEEEAPAPKGNGSDTGDDTGNDSGGK